MSIKNNQHSLCQQDQLQQKKHKYNVAIGQTFFKYTLKLGINFLTILDVPKNLYLLFLLLITVFEF